MDYKYSVELSKEEIEDAILQWLFQFTDENLCKEYLKEQSSQKADFIKKIGNFAGDVLNLITGKTTYDKFIGKQKDAEEQYLSLPVKQWNWLQRLGFFKEIDRTFPSKDNHWMCEPNSDAGYFEFSWHSLPDKNNCDYKISIKLNGNELRIVLMPIELYEINTATAQAYIEKLSKIASNYNLHIKKPINDESKVCITIGFIEEKDWLATDNKGVILLDETKNKLASIVRMVDKLVN